MSAGSVSGSVRLEFSDLVRSSWTLRLKYTILFTALIFLAGNFSQIRNISFDQKSIIPDVIVIAIFIAAFVLFWVLILAANAALCYRRMRNGHLDVSYEIGPDMLLIS